MEYFFIYLKLLFNFSQQCFLVGSVWIFTFVKFILKWLVFYVSVNGIVFLVLNLYPVTLLNSFISSSHFCCRSLRIFNIRFSSNKDSFPSICLLSDCLVSVTEFEILWNTQRVKREVPREESMMTLGEGRPASWSRGGRKKQSRTLECNEFGLTYSLCRILGWRNWVIESHVQFDGGEFVLKKFFLLTFNCFAMLCSFRCAEGWVRYIYIYKQRHYFAN